MKTNSVNNYQKANRNTPHCLTPKSTAFASASKGCFMPEAEIIPIEYGKTYISEAMAYSHGTDQTKNIPICLKMFLIKTEGRLILVDAGCDTLYGFELYDFIGPVKALADINVSPEDITDLILTHSHSDHTDGIKYYKNAQIYIQRDEYKVIADKFAKDTKIITFEDEYQISECVKAVKIGGHSLGSCVVEVLNNGSKSVIVGDECYLRKNLDEKIPTGSSVNPKNSADFIKKYTQVGYTLYLCHDN